MIPDDFKQTLLARVDIVEVVERHLRLKKAGANFVACCPFHNEKTPSFSVSPSKQFYHCFGCGAHGNAIGFLMEFSGMGYVEAIKELAGGAGLTVPNDRSESHSRPQEPGADLGDVLLRAAQYYKDELKRSERAIAYLKRRGLTGEIAARFQIGYAPDGWQNLESVFPDYRAKALTEAGLVIDNDSGKRYDRFRDRIMFPIVNPRGAVIGFGGRVLDAGEPKYLNSPETPLFEKGREVYGLVQAREALREAGRVLVVEGYMDVVALAQSGVGYAVATLGTATTPTHVQKLLRQTDELVFCFDGDDAGRRAAWRALENSLAQLTDAKRAGFLFLPQGEDPDTYVRAHGKAAFEALIAEAVPLSTFLINELTARADPRTEEGRARLLHLAKPLIEQIGAPALGLMLRRRLAEIGGIGLAELDELFGVKRVKTSRLVGMAQRAAVLTSSEVLLRAVMFKPDYAAAIDRSILDPSDLATPALTGLLDLIEASPNLEARTIAAVALEQFRDTVNAVRVHAAATRTLWDESFDVTAEFEGCIGQLRQRYRQRRMDELRQKPSLSAEEQGEYRQLLSQRPGAKMPNSEPVSSV